MDSAQFQTHGPQFFVHLFLESVYNFAPVVRGDAIAMSVFVQWNSGTNTANVADPLENHQRCSIVHEVLRLSNVSPIQEME
jgi:hypothetical protein